MVLTYEPGQVGNKAAISVVSACDGFLFAHSRNPERKS